MKNPTGLNAKPIHRYPPDVSVGLNDVQVAERTEQCLKNHVKKDLSKSYVNILVNNLCTFFNLLGLIVCISLLIVDAPIGDYFFVAIYLANIFIGITQEVRAKKCIDKLSLVTNKSAKVLRNGELIDLSSDDIVLDDIIKLGIGNQIPTDCIVVSGEVEVNESLLTGESVPVKKKFGDLLLAGSFITSGVCFAKAERVGKDNYVQTLSAKAKQYKKPNSELMNSLKFIIKIISCIIVPFAIMLMTKAALSDNFIWHESVRSTATSIIGMIPSGMFLLTSLALAVGIIKLARHNTLVQDLYSLEMLARVDTICFDKTGTITDGKMTVKDVIPLSAESEHIKFVMSSMLGALKDNNQTAIALQNHFGQDCKFEVKTALPFSSARKLSAVTFNDVGTYAFGAPEFVLSPNEYKKIEKDINDYAMQGLRVLILANSKTKIENDTAPKDFLPTAIILIVDNVREDAIETIKWFKENDVAIKVISGDNPITVAEVSKRVGIDGADKFISLEGMSDEEVFNIANDYTVFGRVTPEQKAILVKALKSAGHVTAMTGDGVNDILALKESDCAISVAAGSDAARSISHIVLMDNNFNSMPKVVYEGRRVINNVQSSASLFLMKTMFTMFMTLLTFFAYKTYPFKLSNMILLEVFVIGLPSFFLSFQPNDDRVEGRFISQVLAKSIPSAILMILSVSIVALFGNISEVDTYKTMGVFALTFAGIISLFNICWPLNKYRSILIFTNITIVLLGTLLLLSLPSISGLFGLTSIKTFSESWKDLLIVSIIVIIDVPLSIILQKLWKSIKAHFANKKKAKI